MAYNDTMRDGIRRIFIAVAVVLAGFIIVAAASHLSGSPYGLLHLIRGESPPIFQEEEFTLPEDPVLSPDEVVNLSALDQEMTRLTAAVVPAVVSIATRETIVVQTPFPGYYQRDDRAGAGSGVIVTPQGHIVTNHHVVANKTEIRITHTRSDGRRESLPVDVVGALPAYDIAVLKIQSSRDDFPALQIADSSEVKVGQMVFAVGNPFGLSETVTQGIISATERRFTDTGPAYFQTSAPINPGNSGGPLINVREEIVGINTAVFRGRPATGAAQNIGFALPASDMWEAFLVITGKGRPVYGYLGVVLSDLNLNLAHQLGVESLEGVAVLAVDPDSPAASVGLQQGDILLELDGQTIASNAEITENIRRTPPGRQVELTLRRGDEVLTIEVTLGNSADAPVDTRLHPVLSDQNNLQDESDAANE